MQHLTKTDQHAALYNGNYEYQVNELIEQGWLVKHAVITHNGLFIIYERTTTVCGGEITCMECIAKAD